MVTNFDPACLGLATRTCLNVKDCDSENQTHFWAASVTSITYFWILSPRREIASSCFASFDDKGPQVACASVRDHGLGDYASK